MPDLTPETKPFAGFENFAACRRANGDKTDPDAYCASIMRAVEGKDTEWIEARSWHNDRTLDVFINDGRGDFTNEAFPLQAQVAAMPWFMENGFFEWYHGKGTGGTPVPIGKPLAWRVRDGKVEVRFGIFASEDVGGSPFVDDRWAVIKRWGNRGTVSVTFAPIGPKQLRREGLHAVLEIPKAWMWSVGWVGPHAASPGSTVNTVSDAKSLETYFAALEEFRPHFKATFIPGEEGPDPSAASAAGFKTMGDPSESQGDRNMDLDLGTFIEEHGITELKAEGMLKACQPCRDYVEDLERKGVSHDVAVATFQKKLDEVVAARKSKTARKAAPDPAKKQEGEDCPEGYHKDPDSGECVPDEPKVSEEALKALMTEVKEQRALIMRLLQGQVAAAPQARAIRQGIEKSLEGVPEEVRTKVMGAVEDAFPHDIDTQIRGFVEEFTTQVKADVEAEVRERLDDFSDLLTEVQKKMKIPTRAPRGRIENPGIAFQAANDMAILKAINQKVAGRRGGES